MRKVAIAGIALLLICVRLANAVTIDWLPVGNPGNANDAADGDSGAPGVQSFGSVSSSYYIGKYNITNNQYAEFLNTKDPTGANTLGLFEPEFHSQRFSGIVFNGSNSSGNKYVLVDGRASLPVNFVSWASSIRFANWLNNGQGNGDTENGAYTILGGTPTPTNLQTITRNSGAKIFLPSENEWYKAAYFNPATNSYFQYPTSSNTLPTASAPSPSPNTANFDEVVGDLTPVGAYSGTTSPYGAFDMGGNVFQWNEANTVTAGNPLSRASRGGFWGYDAAGMLSSFRNSNAESSRGYGGIGFRVASVPEPSSFVLAALGLIGLLAWYRRRATSIVGLAIMVVLGLIDSDARAVTIDTVPVGNVGNDNDPLTGNFYGGVNYAYRIGMTEVTNAQYAEFLNAKAASDPLGLYSVAMNNDFRAGITRSGVSGSFTYAAKTDMGNKPVTYVSWYDSIRFANWLNNGQGNGDTETGAYTLGPLDAFGVPSDGNSIARNAGATWFLTSHSEWYKAAYHKNDGVTSNYFAYPTSSDTAPTTVIPPGGGNSANMNFLFGELTNVGAYTASDSPYGTFDQAGNVWEWNEALSSGSLRAYRGGSFNVGSEASPSQIWFDIDPTFDLNNFGFRVATVPEPSSCVLAAIGLISLVTWKRRSRNFVLALCAVGALSSPRISEAGTIVKFDFTNFGSVQVELFDSDAPLIVANFLTRYATVNRYTDTMIHRVDTVLGVVQGGGFTKAAIPVATAADPMIPLEYVHPNTRGTLAMVRLAGPNTATSQWYFNTVNNTNTLGPSNAGGYAVFGQVLGNGMDVIDAIAAVPTFTYTTPFGMVPLQNFTIADFNNNVDPLPHVVVLQSVTIVPEPSSFVLAALGLIGLGFWKRRKR